MIIEVYYNQVNYTITKYVARETNVEHDALTVCVFALLWVFCVSSEVVAYARTGSARQREKKKALHWVGLTHFLLCALLLGRDVLFMYS